MNFMGMPNMNTNMNNNMNNMNNNIMDFGKMNTQSTPSSDMKQIFKNNEITIYCCTNKVYDGNSITVFSISNNIGKQLSNVKVNFLVSRYLVFKVISTSNNVLEPLQSFGIKKVNKLI
jgi:hypothetical protein